MSGYHPRSFRKNPPGGTRPGRYMARKTKQLSAKRITSFGNQMVPSE